MNVGNTTPISIFQDIKTSMSVDMIVYPPIHIASSIFRLFFSLSLSLFTSFRPLSGQRDGGETRVATRLIKRGRQCSKRDNLRRAPVKEATENTQVALRKTQQRKNWREIYISVRCMGGNRSESLACCRSPVATTTFPF